MLKDVVDNLTRGGRPFAVVENAATRKEERNKGYATRRLEFAIRLAADRG